MQTEIHCSIDEKEENKGMPPVPFIPEGYVGIHVPRFGRRGGGIAVIHRSTICVNRLPIVLSHHFLALSHIIDSKYRVCQNCNYLSTTFSELSKVSL
jgi:hypothetical protein